MVSRYEIRTSLAERRYWRDYMDVRPHLDAYVSPGTKLTTLVTKAPAAGVGFYEIVVDVRCADGSGMVLREYSNRVDHRTLTIRPSDELIAQVMLVG